MTAVQATESADAADGGPAEDEADSKVGGCSFSTPLLHSWKEASFQKCSTVHINKLSLHALHAASMLLIPACWAKWAICLQPFMPLKTTLVEYL